MRTTIQRAQTTLGNIYSPSFWRDVEDDFLYVDVGACIGTTVVATAEMYPEINMIAIEPIKANIKKIKSRTAEIKNKVSIVNLGCWSHKSQVPFYCNPTHLSGSTMMTKNQTKKHTDAIVAFVDTLDSIVTSAGYDHVDLLKLDVEGAEHMVLKGFQTTLSDTQFHIEYHCNLSYVLDELLNHEVEYMDLYAWREGGSIYGKFC